MKAAFVCALLVLAVAFCNAQTEGVCDPDSNGKPVCGADVSATDSFRNFWDPTHYWVCNNGQALEAACPTATLYDPKTKTCISWMVWEWESPCPQIN